MQEIIALAVPVLFIFLFIKVLMTPMKLIFKLLLNTGCGFVCLFLLNLLSGFTGIVFELNFITAAIVGFWDCPALFCCWFSSFSVSLRRRNAPCADFTDAAASSASFRTAGAPPQILSFSASCGPWAAFLAA